MTVRINANSCKNVLGTVFLLATVFFVCSTFISMRSVLADPIAPVNTGIAQTGRQSPRSTSRNVSNRTISRSTTSRGTVARTAVASSRTTASRAAVAPTRTAVSRETGSARTVASRAVAPTRSNVKVSGRSVATRGTNASNQSSNRAVRARGATTASRVSATGNVVSSGTRAGVNTMYSYMVSRLNTGYSNIVDSTTGMISAEAYANCLDAYYTCMDEVCTARSEAKGRCSCAGRATNFLAAEEALEVANEELITLSGQLALLIATKGKGDDLAAAFSLTEAEQVMNCVSYRENVGTGKMDDDEWYEAHPTFDSKGVLQTTGEPEYCQSKNNSFGFDISQIDGSSSDILAQLKSWADAKDLASTYATTDDSTYLENIKTLKQLVRKFKGLDTTVTEESVENDNLMNKWGYKLFEYAHNNICGRVLDSCFNGIWEGCGTPPNVKDSDGISHKKCSTGATSNCPFNYNSYISVITNPSTKSTTSKDGYGYGYGDIKLNERGVEGDNAATLTCFNSGVSGWRTTTTESTSTDPYRSLRGPVADARRSIIQKYLLDANAACDAYGENIAQTAQNINYQKVAAQQALQQKRLEFRQQDKSTTQSEYQTATNNFTECQSELWDCYNTYSAESSWTTARIKSYCAQYNQVPSCYKTMVCTPESTSLQAVIDMPDSTSCTFSTDYRENTCRNVVTLSEILYGTGVDPIDPDILNQLAGAKRVSNNVSSAAIRERCLRDALKSDYFINDADKAGTSKDIYSLRGWSASAQSYRCTPAEVKKAWPYGINGVKSSQDATTCERLTACEDGYTPGYNSSTGKYTCDQINCTYGYTDSNCPTEGYSKIGGTCTKGGLTYYESCVENTCDGFDKTETESCDDGYHKDTITCQSGVVTKYKCVVNTCDADYHKQCGQGFLIDTSVPTCQSGEDTYYKCVENPCEDYVNACGEGYQESIGDVCWAGSVKKVKCVEAACEGYVSSCDEGYITATCKQGTQNLYKCHAACEKVPATIDDSNARVNFCEWDATTSSYVNCMLQTEYDTTAHQCACPDHISFAVGFNGSSVPCTTIRDESGEAASCECGYSY